MIVLLLTDKVVSSSQQQQNVYTTVRLGFVARWVGLSWISLPYIYFIMYANYLCLFQYRYFIFLSITLKIIYEFEYNVIYEFSFDIILTH